MKFLTFIAAILLTAPAFAVVPAEAIAVAVQDYQAHAAAGEETRYVSLYEVPAEQRPMWHAVVRFNTVYASRASLIEDQLPQQVAGTQLYRVRLNGVQWSASDFSAVAAGSPYATPVGNRNPLIVRGDWLVWELHDGSKSNAYYRLLYGGANIPKTRDQYLAFWKIDPQAQAGFEFGVIEGDSGINKSRNGARWIEHTYGVVNEHWGTRDVLEVQVGKDPLNAPSGNFSHDAEEHFVLVPKVSNDGVRGVMAATILADGNGNIVHAAPADYLEDYTRVANSPIVRNPGSCISCHAEGSQKPTTNAIERVLKNGTLLYAKDQATQSFVERFHLGGVAKELGRWSDDYNAACLAVTGMDSRTVSRLYRECIAQYAADVTLDRAAGELLTDAQSLRLAIGNASANKIDVGVRLAELADGRPMPRTAWESEYHKANGLLAVWRSKS